MDDLNDHLLEVFGQQRLDRRDKGYVIRPDAIFMDAYRADPARRREAVLATQAWRRKLYADPARHAEHRASINLRYRANHPPAPRRRPPDTKPPMTRAQIKRRWKDKLLADPVRRAALNAKKRELRAKSSRG